MDSDPNPQHDEHREHLKPGFTDLPARMLLVFYVTPGDKDLNTGAVYTANADELEEVRKDWEDDHFGYVVGMYRLEALAASKPAREETEQEKLDAKWRGLRRLCKDLLANDDWEGLFTGARALGIRTSRMDQRACAAEILEIVEERLKGKEDGWERQPKAE